MRANRRAADKLKLENKQEKDFQETLQGHTGSPKNTLAEGRPIEESMNSQCSTYPRSSTNQKRKITKYTRFSEMLEDCPIMDEYYFPPIDEVDIERLKEEFCRESPGEKSC